MTALWIVGILLLILLAVQCSRVGVQIAFGEETRVVARLGLIRLQIMPQKERQTPKKEKTKKKETKKPAKEPWKPDFSTIWGSLPELWRILKKGLRMTFRRIRISPMDFSAVIGGEDPADTAILYGKLNAAMWSVLPPLQELVDMPDAHVHMEPDLQGGESNVSGDVGLSFLIWDMTVIGFACGIPLIKWFIKLRKQAPDVKNDTNSQSGKDEQHGKQAEDQPQRNDGDLHEQGAGDGQQ